MNICKKKYLFHKRNIGFGKDADHTILKDMTEKLKACNAQYYHAADLKNL